MDAVKFIKEWNRMCKFYYDAKEGYCSCECPVHCFQCFNLKNLSANAEEMAAAIEKWSTGHPRKTRQSVFLEQWPNVLRINGTVMICPGVIDGNFSCPINTKVNIDCFACKQKFWSQEVE